MALRVLIADDHAVMREGLRLFLELDPAIEVVGDAQNGAEALKLTAELRPQVVLMDLLMPVMDGVAATEEIRRLYPDTEVVALTSALDDAYVTSAIRAGAIGYLVKNAHGEEVVQAVKSAAAGQVHLSPEVTAHLVREIRIPHSPEHFTDREMDVLRLLSLGLANKEIGAELGIAEKTVKTHVSNVFTKLNVRSRTQAALYAVQSGIAPTEHQDYRA